MPKINWDEWSDEECKAAWKELRKEHDAIELMYAFYGGILSKEVEMQCDVTSIKKHCTPATTLSIDFTKPAEVAENWIQYDQGVPIKVFEELLENYKFTDKEAANHEGIYSDKELTEAYFELSISTTTS